MSRLEVDEVHVWYTALDALGAWTSELRRLLTPEECERADRFQFPIHSARFIAGRWLVRAVLSSYLNIDPARVPIVYEPHGKPVLTAGGDDLTFNLSHSEGDAVLAVSRIRSLGVDIERIRPLSDLEGMCATVFAPREVERWRTLPPEDRLHAFFSLWTRKEAYIKAVGAGLSLDPRRLEVTFAPGEDPALLAIDGARGPAQSWHLQTLALGERAPVALCAERTRESALRVRPFCLSRQPRPIQR
jgi:4'-phosphopantetheinyl transferase